MGVREDIIDSMHVVMAETAEAQVYYENTKQPARVRHCERLGDMAIQARNTARECVPVHVNLQENEIDTLAPASYQFGLELLEYEGDADKHLHRFCVDKIALPYPRMLVYGAALKAHGGGRVAYFVENHDCHLSMVQLMTVQGASGISWAPYLIMCQDKQEDYLRAWPSAVLSKDIEGTGMSELDKQWADQVFLNSVDFMIGFYGMLNMKQLESVDVPASQKVNKARSKKGKELISDVTEIRLTKAARAAMGSGTHASPRPHWRRGHVRQLSSGKKIPVQPHMVMAKEGVPLPKRVEVKA